MPPRGDANSYKHRGVTDLTSLASLEYDPFEINIWVAFFEFAVTPLLNSGVDFLVEARYGSQADFGAPQSLGDILNTAY